MMPLGYEANWQEEWQVVVRRRDALLAHARELQAEISAVLRRRQPLPMDLLRAAERTEDELSALKVRLRDILRRVG
jgi:hypothetical protein